MVKNGHICSHCINSQPCVGFHQRSMLTTVGNSTAVISKSSSSSSTQFRPRNLCCFQTLYFIHQPAVSVKVHTECISKYVTPFSFLYSSVARELVYVLLRCMGHVVAQWVEALRHKPEGRGFDSRYDFFGHTVALGSTQLLTEISTWNIYCGGGGEGGRCIRLTTLPRLCADCHEVWEPQPPGNRRAYTGL